MSKERILEMSMPEPNSGCWLWLRCRTHDGYGKLGFKGTVSRAHRVSFECFKYDPGKLWVLHKCDTPACVNPDHLFLGTPADNLEDSYRKGRKGKISRSEFGTIKLRRLNGASIRQLAKDYNVHQNAIRWRIEHAR